VWFDSTHRYRKPRVQSRRAPWRWMTRTRIPWRCWTATPRRTADYSREYFHLISRTHLFHVGTYQHNTLISCTLPTTPPLEVSASFDGPHTYLQSVVHLLFRCPLASKVHLHNYNQLFTPSSGVRKLRRCTYTPTISCSPPLEVSAIESDLCGVIACRPPDC
jgi:hypothetical protein